MKKCVWIMMIEMICLSFAIRIPASAQEENTGSDAVVVSDREELYKGISRQIREHKTSVCYDTVQGAVGADIEEVIDGYFYHYDREEPINSGSYLSRYLKGNELVFLYQQGSFSPGCNFRMEVQVEYDYTKQEMDEYFAYMHELAATLKKETDYQSVKSVHDYLIKNYDYDYLLGSYLDYEGYLTGSMVCQGYCMAAFYLLAEMGIPVRIVIGSAEDVETDPDHAWNVVKVEGKWYNMDVTWDDQGKGKRPSYTFFLKSDADFYRHTREGKYDYDRDMAIVSYRMPDRSTEIFTAVFIVALVIGFAVIRSRISSGDA